MIRRVEHLISRVGKRTAELQNPLLKTSLIPASLAVILWRPCKHRSTGDKLDTMRNLTFILTFLLTWTSQCAGQNKTTKEGLNVGKWIDEYELANGKFRETGYYKIIPLTTYDTIRPLGENIFEVKFKGSSPLLFFSGRHGNSISVKDSIWQTVDSIGKIYKTENWVQGLNLWTKYFDGNGNMTKYDYDDFENDTSFYLTYKNNQLYKKAFYPPDNKNQQTEIFYPDNNLVIPNAEPSFYYKFGDIAVNVFQLKLSCKQDLIINTVSSSSGNIQVTFPFNSVPYKLTKTDTAIFNLIFTPTPTSFTEDDTITIITSEENVLPYKIYCSLSASHIDGSNVETLSKLILSKSKDRYLLIAPMGTQTDAFITDSKGNEKRYRIQGITKIDLAQLKAGDYQLSIASCNTGGDIKLNIVE